MRKKAGYIGLFITTYMTCLYGCDLKEPCQENDMYFDTETGTCQLISAEHCPENDIINCHDKYHKDKLRVSQWACKKIVMLNEGDVCDENATDRICKSPLECSSGKCQCLRTDNECNTDDIGNKKYLCEIKDCILHYIRILCSAD